MVPEGIRIDPKRAKSLRAVLSHPDVEIETRHKILQFIYTGTAKVEESMLSKNAFEFHVLCDTPGHHEFKDLAILEAASNMVEAVEYGRDVLSGMSAEHLDSLIRFKWLGKADKWRLLVGWAKARQGCEDLSIDAGITPDFNADKGRDDIANLVPA
ncbi:hypothetical protein HDU98_007401, partial [Podochytrium sp. JEL0797]